MATKKKPIRSFHLKVDRAFIEVLKKRAALERRTMKQFIIMACEKALATEVK